MCVLVPEGPHKRAMNKMVSAQRENVTGSLRVKAHVGTKMLNRLCSARFHSPNIVAFTNIIASTVHVHHASPFVSYVVCTYLSELLSVHNIPA